MFLFILKGVFEPPSLGPYLILVCWWGRKREKERKRGEGRGGRGQKGGGAVFYLVF